jgi:4-amino-4-deoxy-L-arabinose transferase-like glycosyltransferase
MPSIRALWVLAALLTAIWFVNLDTRRLIHPDEGRYAEIAREMAATGDWVTPRLNDLKYFEKPPLQYWITASAYRAFGVHEWTARLWPAFAGFLGILSIGYAGFALGGAMLGTLASFVLAGMLWHAAMAQILTLDSGLSFFLALGFAGFVIAQRAEATANERRVWMWVVWAAMSGATLSKGLIGIALPGGALFTYSVVTRDFALWRRLHVASGLVLYLILTVPWFVAVSRANPEFFHFFFIHEHFERFLTTEHHRPGAWYYFVPLLLAGLLPWLTVILYGMRSAWRDGVRNPLGFSWQRFALVFAAFVFVFFSASESKLPSYILPMFPPLALVIAWLVMRLPPLTLYRLLLPLVVIAAAVAAVAFVAYEYCAPRIAGSAASADKLLAFGPYLKASALVEALVGIGALAALRLVARPDAARLWGIALLSLASLAGFQIANAGYNVFSTTRSASAILARAQEAAPIAPETPFYQVEMYDQTVPYYLGRPTRLVHFRDELALGIDAEPSKAIPTIAAWITEWAGLPQGYALMPPELQQKLAAQGVPMRVLASDLRRVVVSRR